MLNTYETKSLANLKLQSEIGARQLNREIRIEQAKQSAKRRLRRDVERLIKAEGSMASVIDVIDRLSMDSKHARSGRAEPTCC